MLNLSRKSIIEKCRTLYGTPGTDANNIRRGNICINLALAHLWREMPARLKETDWFFKLEPPKTYGTLLILTAIDPRLCMIDVAADVPGADGGTDEGVLEGRWVEILDPVDQRWVVRRVRDVFRVGGAPTNYFTIDEPFRMSDTGTWTDIEYRIYTREYPLPPWFSKVKEVSFDDGVSPRTPLEIVGPSEINQRFQGRTSRKQEGTPAYCGPGATYQLPVPRFKPVASQSQAPNLWGYEADGLTEHGVGGAEPAYGPAGTFTYIACLGWGTRPWLHPQRGWQASYGPFYLSAASLPSDPVTVEWGAGAVKLELANAEWVHGFYRDSGLPSYGHSGLKWWIFRARSAYQDPTALTNNAVAKMVETADAYELWRVVSASTTEVYDRGDYDPPDREFPLMDNFGQTSIMFDFLPSEARIVRVRGERRMIPLEHDADVLPVPPEMADAFFPLLASYLVGRREGQPDTESAHFQMYTMLMNAARAEENTIGAAGYPMGYCIPGAGHPDNGLTRVLFNPYVTKLS